MHSRFVIQLTGDGSSTVYDKLLNVSFHSTHGAVAETNHVFIDAGLAYLGEQGYSCIDVLEMGFGTGLNAVLSMVYGRESDIKLRYTAFETQFIPTQLFDQLQYDQLIPNDEHHLYHKMYSHLPCDALSIRPGFDLTVINSPIDSLTALDSYDLVYYDAFGPSASPELWDVPVLTKVHAAMRRGAVLVTFCAQGQFKRNLKSLGMQVESLPGPPGKREMVRAMRTS